MGYKVVVQTVDEDAQLINLTLSNPPVIHDDEDIQLILDLTGDPVTYSVVLGGEYNTATFNGVRLIGYLMQDLSTVVNGASATFKIYSISQPNWVETLLYTGAGVVQPNNYFFLDLTETSLGIELDGDPTLLLEVSIVRLGKTYKNRIYLNQLGIYASYFNLKRQVNIIQTTKTTDELWRS